MEERLNKNSREGKYLTFRLGEEQYGLGILSVKEIIGMMPVTALPNAPRFMLGVINLRGKVIPIIDLRRKFAMPTVEHTDRTCIIVVETAADSSSTRLVGIVVDAVAEVLHIRSENIEDAPQLGDKNRARAIMGMAKEDGGVKILLDIDKALGSSEHTAMGKAA